MERMLPNVKDEEGKRMRRFFSNPWFLLFFLTAIGIISVGLTKGLATPINQLIAGGLLGFALGVANLVELSFRGSRWFSAFVNGIVGALTGLALAYLLGKAFDQMVWYFLSGAILGVS